MVEWSKDHVTTIVTLNLNSGLVGRIWLNWRPGRALRWKVEIISWEDRGVICRKLAPLRL
jgi:hypothetical protein